MAATCYATFGQIVQQVTLAESYQIRLLQFPPRFITPIFILINLGSFFIQLLGASAIGTTYSNKDLSTKQQQDQVISRLAALRLGFALQLVYFGLFIIVRTRFLFVSRRQTTRPLQYRAPLGASQTQLNQTVSIATIAITVGKNTKLVYTINS